MQGSTLTSKLQSHCHDGKSLHEVEAFDELNKINFEIEDVKADENLVILLHPKGDYLNKIKEDSYIEGQRDLRKTICSQCKNKGQTAFCHDCTTFEWFESIKRK